MSILRSQTLVMAQTLSQAVYGRIQLEIGEHALIQNEMKENAKLLNKQLENKEWLCGTASPTIADYQMAIAMTEQYQCIMEINTVKSLNNFNKFMKRVTQLPEFKERMGNIKPAKK